MGAGEIFLSSVDLDGTHLGYDIELAERLIPLLNIPIVIASGAGAMKDISKLLETVKPSGISVGSALHYDKLKVKDIYKEFSND